MGLTCKNGSHFQKEKSSQFQREKPWEQGWGKRGHTLKKYLYLEKWVTLQKIRHTLENESFLDKLATLENMGHTGGKLVTLRKMCDT